MKIMALEKDKGNKPAGAFKPYLKAEAEAVWKLYKEGIIREIYFMGNRAAAVIILECANGESALQYLNELPLVKNNLITFDVIPLVPYPGFERLFENN